MAPLKPPRDLPKSLRNLRPQIHPFLRTHSAMASASLIPSVSLHKLSFVAGPGMAFGGSRVSMSVASVGSTVASAVDDAIFSDY
ncbi:hypothetical protein QJS10_CPB20g00219 [Acorus calamus]|uniref:Uncharacterized protein n=1 Tax=Acorus calamus TaxID=4465 RepID=A0AAV9CDQ1_ACOCL|nr:hypothetical protein QJS10_CPB20g00219 [Acorus calamus]